MAITDLRRLVYHAPEISRVKLARLAEKEKKRVQLELLYKLQAMGLVWIFSASEVSRKQKEKIKKYRLRIGNRAFFCLPQKNN